MSRRPLALSVAAILLSQSCCLPRCIAVSGAFGLSKPKTQSLTVGSVRCVPYCDTPVAVRLQYGSLCSTCH